MYSLYVLTFRLLILAAVFLSASCSKEIEISQFTMLTPSSYEDRLYKIYDNDGARIIHITHTVENQRLERIENPVYINNNSQFVYVSGEPVYDSLGFKIYWNDKGQIVNSRLERIPESRIFESNGSPLPDNTPIRLDTQVDKKTLER